MFAAVADSPRDNDDEQASDATSDAPVVSRLFTATSPALPVMSDVASNIDLVQPTVSASGPASVDSLTVSVGDCAVISSDASHVGPEVTDILTHSVADSDPSLARSEPELVVPNTSGVDRSSYTDERCSSSPEIDVLPVVRRAKAISDHGPASSSVVSVNAASLLCSRLGISVALSRPSVHRSGSPEVDDDGQFSHYKQTSGPAAVTGSESMTVGGVKLIPLSQVMSTSSDTENCSVKISQVTDISTQAAGTKTPSSRRASRSSQQTNELVQLPTAKRRRSSRLRVPKSILSAGKDSADGGRKAVKFDTKASLTDKENVCMPTATVQAAVSCRQPLHFDVTEITQPVAKSRAGSCDTLPSGDESGVSETEVRQSFIKRARRDIEQTDRLRLPAAWERQVRSSPAVSQRRMSDRIRRKEDDTVLTQSSHAEVSSSLPFSGRKRRASSGSSGLSSGEKKSAKKLTRTIAMTSLHSQCV